jgi:hypothetical protein
MKKFVVLGTAILLTACAHSDIEKQHKPAAGPSVGYPYSSLQEYRDAAAKADDYCTEHYGAEAHPTGDYNPSGGEAVFLCVSGQSGPQLLTPTNARPAPRPSSMKPG